MSGGARVKGAVVRGAWNSGEHGLRFRQEQRYRVGAVGKITAARRSSAARSLGTHEETMDWLTFWSKIVDSVAWPLAAVLAFLLLRHPLVDLLAAITSLKVKDVEINFGRGVAKLQEAAATALVPGPTLKITPAISEEAAKLAKTSPRAAVIEGWQGVSAEAIAALRRRHVSVPSGNVAPKVIEDLLAQHQILSEDQIQVLRQLRNLRNAAVHGSAFALATGEALEYVATANRLAALLRGTEAV